MASKPMPKLGQTKAIMDEFVRTGKIDVNAKHEASNDSGIPASQLPSFLGSTEDDIVPESVSSLLGAVQASGVSEVPPVLREVYNRQEKETLVKRTYEIPKSLADKIRVVVAVENVTSVSVITEALELWLREYIAAKAKLRGVK